MTINVTPIPRLLDLAAPAFTLGTANAAGSAVTAVASDATLLAFDTTPPANVIAGSAVVGTATTAPRRDHQHSGLAAFDSTNPASVAAAAVVGSATTVPHRDHVHPGIPGAGTVVDNAITRFDGTSGFALQGYSSLSPTISDAGISSLTSGALKFPATAIASSDANTLDDFEIGDWTPGIADSSLNPTGEGQVYTIAEGHYVRIANCVMYHGRVALDGSSNTMTGANPCSITGLPFSAAGGANNYVSGSCSRASNVSLTAGYNIGSTVKQGSTILGLTVWDSAAGVTDLSVTEFSVDGDIMVSGHYLV